MSQTEDQKYEAVRLIKLNDAKFEYNNFKATHSISAALNELTNLLSQAEDHSALKFVNNNYHIGGRITACRKASKKLYFFVLESNGETIQIVANFEDYNQFSNFDIVTQINRGDIVGIQGFVGTTKINKKVVNNVETVSGGEKSLYATNITLLAPCLKLLTTEHTGFTNIDARAKQVYLDMIINKKRLHTIKTRHQIITTIRTFLNGNNFTEVQTPILSTNIGGANAQPFITEHNALNRQVFLRIAPELYLKQLVIGGLERVYEIGSQFRNEDIDATHVPEFTSIEFYMAYANYKDMMSICQEMLTTIIKQVNNNSLIINFNNTNIDFTPPYKSINIMDELESQLGIIFPKDLYSAEAKQILDNLCVSNSIECSAPRTTSRLLDKLIGKYIEPLCTNPTFLIGHPMVMSPLAKSNSANPTIADRFELFVNKFEIANAYSEQNDPQEQFLQFQNQVNDRNNGDNETPIPDSSFVNALKYGLPPTGGFGMGIDRLIMLLTNNTNIRDVIAFPPTISL